MDLKFMILSEAIVNRLNELHLPNTPEVHRILELLFSKSNQALIVKDKPDGDKKVFVIEIPEPPNTHGTNPPD